MAEGSLLADGSLLAEGSPLPDWLHYDTDLKVLSGIPELNDMGTLEFRVTNRTAALIISTVLSVILYRNMLKISV